MHHLHKLAGLVVTVGGRARDAHGRASSPHRPTPTRAATFRRRARTGPATSCRPATTAGCRPPPTRRDQLPLYDGLTPAARQRHRRRHRQPLPAGGLRAGRRDPRGGHRPARPDDRSTTSTACPTSTGRHAGRRRLRRRLGDGARPRPAASSSVAVRRGWRWPTCPASTRSRWSPAASRSCRARRPRRSSPPSRTCSCKTYGDKGREILADAQAEADGINAYWKANDINQPPATVNDVIAVTAFIGSIFGAGGGGEARNSELLAQLQNQLGPVQGHAGVERRDARPTTPRRRPRSSSASTTAR